MHAHEGLKAAITKVLSAPGSAAALSPSKRLMGILRPIIRPPASLLAINDANLFHRRPVVLKETSLALRGKYRSGKAPVTTSAGLSILHCRLIQSELRLYLRDAFLGAVFFDVS